MFFLAFDRRMSIRMTLETLILTKLFVHQIVTEDLQMQKHFEKTTLQTDPVPDKIQRRNAPQTPYGFSLLSPGINLFS